MANENVLITNAEETAIKEKAPDKLPLNPTAQGYSGQEVRKRMAAYVIDNEESVLQVIKDKLINVKTKFDYFDDLLTEQSTFNTLELNGRLFQWDETVGAITIDLSDSFTLNVGQQMVYYGKAYQENINKGDPVMFAGVEGNHFRLKVATPQQINTNPEYFIGIATQDILSGAFGYVVEFGVVKDVDVGSFQAGDILWYDSTSGGLTTTKPNRDKAQIRIAAVVEPNQNENQLGMLFVRMSILEGGGGSGNLIVSSDEPDYVIDNDIWFDLSGGE